MFLLCCLSSKYQTHEKNREKKSGNAFILEFLIDRSNQICTFPLFCVQIINNEMILSWYVYIASKIVDHFSFVILLDIDFFENHINIQAMDSEEFAILLLE